MTRTRQENRTEAAPRAAAAPADLNRVDLNKLTQRAPGAPRVAVVHDYLTQRGGAERVVLSMLKIFPDAPLYTALYEPDDTFPEFKRYDIRPLWTNRVAMLRQHHRRGLMLYPFAFSRLHIDAEVILCSSSGFAHGATTTGRKVVYCYTPPRWLYDQADTYLAGWPAPVAALVRAAGPLLRRWDKRAATSADCYLANSPVARVRVAQEYGIEATVVPPPVDALEGDRPVPGIEPGFILCVARLLAYKNVEAVCQAADLLPRCRLVIVGEGPMKERIAEANHPNVSLLGRIDDGQLSWLYNNCAGLVAASYEDFGLVALEAAAHGKPVAVLRAGGFLDTVVEGQTGVFFDQPDPASISAALEQLVGRHWNPDTLRAHASSYGEASFAQQLRSAMSIAA